MFSINLLLRVKKTVLQAEQIHLQAPFLFFVVFFFHEICELAKKSILRLQQFEWNKKIKYHGGCLVWHTLDILFFWIILGSRSQYNIEPCGEKCVPAWLNEALCGKIDFELWAKTWTIWGQNFSFLIDSS